MNIHCPDCRATIALTETNSFVGELHCSECGHHGETLEWLEQPELFPRDLLRQVVTLLLDSGHPAQASKLLKHFGFLYRRLHEWGSLEVSVILVEYRQVLKQLTDDELKIWEQFWDRNNHRFRYGDAIEVGFFSNRKGILSKMAQKASDQEWTSSLVIWPAEKILLHTAWEHASTNRRRVKCR